MTIQPKSALRLKTNWTPATDGESLAYSLTLTNLSSKPMQGFKLCVSGPARIDPAAVVEGGSLTARLSNHSELSPPASFVLEPNASWTVTARGLSYPLRHWTDGANTAYVALADGTTLPVAVAPTQAKGDNAPLKRGAEIYPVPTVAPVPVAIVPWPNNVSISGRAPVPMGFALKAKGAEAEAAAATFGELVDGLFSVEGIVRPEAEGGLPVSLSLADDFGPEAYSIRFAADRVVVSGRARNGLLYGLITLGQMLRGARHHPETFLFPAEGEIRDEPALGWRGTHLDVARHFYGTAEISRFLKIMAWNKLNRFHWHLSDDEAWRIEIDAYPDLTRIGAWRGHGLPLPPLLGSGPARTGGYYNKASVRAVVAQAGRLGIEVIPEIDVPGHCYAMLQAIPELRDPAEHGFYQSVQGFPNNCLNPAREETYQVLETVLDEVIELFPFKRIHVGADEVPIGAWSGSPEALARLTELAGPEAAAAHARRLNVITNHHGADDIDGSGAAVLQAQFLARIQRFLASRGCITGGWEEAAHGDVIEKEKSFLNGWRSVEVSAALAGRGYDIVVCPGQVYYLDMANSPAWSEPGAAWAGWSEPQTLYEFDPVKGWTDEQKKHFLGVQCCIWSEPMSDRGVFDRLVFPRISALAETGWTKPERKSWERFKALAGLMPILYGIAAVG
ncbi:MULTISPECIES: beta-N-acetylhexosaminidase [Phyllobacteriaceae]|jgi:hexosaminidase|uniref:beta-N-acetylhexosaminidase n=1 Tax=Mesorhizobium hungaricum TaxID=1566387 RepID=A0A1C2DYM4_9HYPH|nr:MULTISPECIES: beta-N-acetylhexosaminidase [Mesorhizobium]MBN9234717.1 beta-N-acetylhexosaminidase [Mesorhizobium sp.]MDQ0328802.1 hexosaminidase [Mesorhizobium sp. YL-MeA3-2017]OCX19861.1 beta-N-acetylhexosaminidase [Mesorhizobium hungaricum]